MIQVLRNRAYAKLFGAQVIALTGTGLLTVALGLLAFDIAGDDAGVVLGTALAIKMIAYVVVSPIMIALVAKLSPKRVLVTADLARAMIALSLPWVTEAWHIYILIFLLQSSSATFTPTFQALIPSVLPDERDYTRALSLSRLAYDLESLVSPMLAVALLTMMTYHSLFIGTVVGFVVSAALVIATALPKVEPARASPFIRRVTQGTRDYLARPELRALLGLNLVVATTTAMVVVNTVVLVQGALGRTQADVALLLGAYGCGSMIVALSLPRLLDSLPERRVMLASATVLPLALVAMSVTIAWTPGVTSGTAQWIALLALWAITGAATSGVLTPSARLLRRATTEANRPGVFAAQFSLSHACFLITYPLAGIGGASGGFPPSLSCSRGSRSPASASRFETGGIRAPHKPTPQILRPCD